MKCNFTIVICFLLTTLTNAQLLNGDFNDWEVVAGNEKPKYWNTNQLPELNSLFKVDNENNRWIKFEQSDQDEYEIYGSIDQIILSENLPSNAILHFSLRTKSLNADSTTYFRS